MDIRTKLALTLVFVSLLSMSLLGAFAYQTSSELLREISIRQLDALAESKARDLSKVQLGWQDQVRLIKGAIELDSILRDYHAGDSNARSRLEHLVEHALAAVKNVKRIRIVGVQGQVLAWGEDAEYAQIPKPTQEDEIIFGGAFLGEHNKPRVVFSTLLSVDSHTSFISNESLLANRNGDPVLGYLEIVFDASELDSLTRNYTGLGKTGEVLVVTLDSNGGVIVLNKLRHEVPTPPMESLAKSSAAVQKVLAGHSGIFTDELDYRGERVLAATRYLPDLKWGLVVKVDATEEGLRAETLLDAMFDIGMALSAFAIIGGTLLGFYLARPIHELAVLVGRVRHGEFDLRAEVEGDDEIAYLADSLNELLDQLPPITSEDKTPDV